MITNYEHSNFSVSQSRYEDGASPNLVPSPSNDTSHDVPPTHINRNVTIGVSIGVSFLIILILLLLSFVTLKKRRKDVEADGTSLCHAEMDPEPVASTSTTQEIGGNSLYGALQELHNNETVELSDMQAVSGSRNNVIEPPRSATPSADGPDPLREDPKTLSTDLPYTQDERSDVLSSSLVQQSRTAQPGTRSSEFLSLHADKPLPTIPPPIPRRAVQERRTPRDLSHTSNVKITGLRQPPHGRLLSMTTGQDSLWARPDLSRVPTESSQTYQVLPLVPNIGKFSCLRQDHQTVQSEAGSIRSTYATIFDYDDYQDSSANEESPVEVLRDQLFRHIN